MSELPQFLMLTLGLGIAATLLMDIWSTMLRRMGVATLNYAMIGRWCLHWRRGLWFHPSIRNAPAVAGENILGWTLHYLTGILFAMVFVCLAAPEWVDAPKLAPALIFGGATVLLPWLVVQPALGAGLVSSKTPHPWQSRMAGMATHLVFGASLFLGAKLITLIQRTVE